MSFNFQNNKLNNDKNLIESLKGRRVPTGRPKGRKKSQNDTDDGSPPPSPKQPPEIDDESPRTPPKKDNNNQKQPLETDEIKNDAESLNINNIDFGVITFNYMDTTYEIEIRVIIFGIILLLLIL